MTHVWRGLWFKGSDGAALAGYCLSGGMLLPWPQAGASCLHRLWPYMLLYVRHALLVLDIVLV